MSEIANTLGAVVVVGLTVFAVFPTLGSDVFPAKKTAIAPQTKAARVPISAPTALAGSDRLISEGGTLAIAGTKFPAITNEFTPKGRYTIGPKTYSPIIGGYYYPFKVEDYRLMSDRNPLKRTIGKMTKPGEQGRVAYSIHAGQKTNGCIILSPGDFAKAEAAGLEGKTVDIR
jgi:hypothetical protein